jgi:PKD repeat protein
MKMKTKNNFSKLLSLCLGLLITMSCSEDDVVINAPLAFFTAEVSADNNLMWDFTNGSQDGDSYVWNFGDGTGTSTESSPSYTYAAAGNYTVTLTATNAGGDHSYTEAITVLENAPVNLLAESDFNFAEAWTVINHYECTNERGEITIAGGIATWTETEQAADGGWKHMGVYQEIELEAGTYSVDFDVEYADIADVWGELYVGITIPTACTETVGTDYTDNKVLTALNAWDCNQTYTGSAVENACNVPEEGTNGQFTLDAAGTYYILFRAGGGSYGTSGIKLSNIVLYQL